MELQCKERVDTLEALKKSRKEMEQPVQNVEKVTSSSTSYNRPPIYSNPNSTFFKRGEGGIGDGTIPPITSSDIPKATPPLPPRPALTPKVDSFQAERSWSTTSVNTIAPPATLPIPPARTSRTPSPDKKGGRLMLTTLRGPKDSKGRPSKAKNGAQRLKPPHASSKAAGLAWDSTSRSSSPQVGESSASHPIADSMKRDGVPAKPTSTNAPSGNQASPFSSPKLHSGTRTPPQAVSVSDPVKKKDIETAERNIKQPTEFYSIPRPQLNPVTARTQPPPPPIHKILGESQPSSKPPVEYPSYRTEFPPTAPSSRATAEFNTRTANRDEGVAVPSVVQRRKSPGRSSKPPTSNGLSRKPMANTSSHRPKKIESTSTHSPTSESNDESASSGLDLQKAKSKSSQKSKESIPMDPALENEGEVPQTWEDRVKHIRKNLPKGVDEAAAKQIFNEIVVKGDEVHWPDVAGLDAAKTALKEAVVYPFLRPDLFMGLREPARGMLLFGPPGTGKTMLARAVATESRSTFFAISASSLTSKWLGESEKLVRALFQLAKALAPSIIFVDEIDSLLSSRGGSSEHETTRRIKTEFLIQWSDLQRAAAGSKQTDKKESEGDASRVLVLAATNLPWAIDEAARRRFVRRQYIPLPESHVRGEQLRTLLGHQKHDLNRKDIQVLIELTDGKLSFVGRKAISFLFILTLSATGFSGSDITALAKDAAMGPLRSLGEALLYMSREEIRPINFSDFEASLLNIRPSVNKEGLKAYEDWAKEFGERGV